MTGSGSSGFPERTSVAQHQTLLSALVENAEQSTSRRNWSTAAANVQIAAAYAWLNHAGLFASPGLESTLQTVSMHLRHATIEGYRTTDVLHVVTQAYGTGGSTQAVASWIDRDQDRTHRVCLTQQGPGGPPEKLQSRLAGDDLVDLTRTSRDLVARAGQLRALAELSSIVVVHTHPYDVVPSLAFAAHPHIGTIFVDHADHVFWIGTSIPGLFVHMRESGKRMAFDRRGIAPERSHIMARPLAMGSRTLSRREARTRLGIDPDAFLVATTADGSKYQSVLGRGLLDVAGDFFVGNKNSLLVAAGPSPTGEWARYERLSGGRIRALGLLQDVSVLHQAADVYLDSFPFSSLTAMLEAGRFGVPLVTFRGHPDGCGVLGADTPGVDEVMLTPSTAAELERCLLELSGDVEVRKALGARTAEAVAAAHAPAPWLAAVEDTYARALRTTSSSIAAVVPGPRIEPVDLLLCAIQDQTSTRRGIDGAVRLGIPFEPARARARSWVARLTAGQPVPPSYLLGARSMASVTELRRRIGVRRR